jgi:hypothetical protein
VFFPVCVSSVLGMVDSRSTSSTVSRRWLFLIFISIMFVAGTLNFTGTWAMTQQDFVDNRLFPGGPTAYYLSHFSRPGSKMRSMAYVVANIFADGTMVSYSSVELDSVSDIRCLCSYIEHLLSGRRTIY